MYDLFFKRWCGHQGWQRSDWITATVFWLQDKHITCSFFFFFFLNILLFCCSLLFFLYVSDGSHFRLVTLAASLIVSGLASLYIGSCFVEIWTTLKTHYGGTSIRTLVRNTWPDSTRLSTRTLFELYISRSELDLANSLRLSVICSRDIEPTGEFLAFAGKFRGQWTACVFKIACCTWSLWTIDISSSQLFIISLTVRRNKHGLRLVVAL